MNFKKPYRVYVLIFLTVLAGSYLIKAEASLAQEAASEESVQEEHAKEQLNPVVENAPLIPLRLGRNTHSVDIGGIFYTKAQKDPDFRAWVREMPAVKEALDIDRAEIFRREYNRTVKAFREIKTDKDIYVVSKINFDEYSELQGIQIINAFSRETFFRYSAFGENFAVIPNNIHRFHTIAIDPKRRQEMIAKNAYGQTFRVEVIVRIRHVDANKPMAINGQDYWLMLADIGAVRLWTDSDENPELLWRYKADWFIIEDNQELLDLYNHAR
jgi:hypothetical protein